MIFFGLAIVVTIMGGMMYANSRRWRYLSSAYANSDGKFIEKRTMQDAVLVGLGGFNTIKGILTIGVSSQGVSLRMLKPFSLFHTPMFIPYSDIRGWKTTWYLNAKSTELELLNAPDVKIIMPTEQVSWIRELVSEKMSLSDASPPEGNAGRGAHLFAKIHAIIGIAMAASIIWFFLTK